MSRETELAVLHNMKQTIISIYETVDQCKETQSKYAQLQAERENNTRTALNLPCPNKKSSLEKELTERWRNKHLNNEWIKNLCIIAGGLIILAYIVLVFFDLFGSTAFFPNSHKISDIGECSILESILDIVIWLAGPVLIAILPYLIFKGSELKAILICIVVAVALEALCYYAVGPEVLFPVIPFVITMLCGIFIPLFRKIRSKHPVFTTLQLQQLSDAEQQDKVIIADNQLKNEQADREWSEMRAKRLPEIDAEQRRLAEQLEQLKNKLDNENTALEEMKGLGNDEKQLDIIDSLIYFIDTCRADSIKEALHEYDNMLANQQLLELQRQRNKLEEQRIANKAADRKKQLQLMEKLEAERRHAEYDSARARQEMISAVRSMEWYQWADFNGLNKK